MLTKQTLVCCVHNRVDFEVGYVLLATQECKNSGLVLSLTITVADSHQRNAIEDVIVRRELGARWILQNTT